MWLKFPDNVIQLLKPSDPITWLLDFLAVSVNSSDLVTKDIINIQFFSNLRALGLRFKDHAIPS